MTLEEAKDNNQKDMSRIEKALDTLREHFDTVQIFTTKHGCTNGDGIGTISFRKGFGNYYARYGQVQQWLIKENKSVEIEVMEENEL